MLPDVPTVGETLNGYAVVNRFGLVAPAATPRDIINRFHSEIVRTLRMPDIREKLVACGADSVGSLPEEFASFMKADTAKWARVIKEKNIGADWPAGSAFAAGHTE